MDLAIKEALLERSKECAKLDDFIPYLEAVELSRVDLEQISSAVINLFLPNFGERFYTPNKSPIDCVIEILVFWKNRSPMSNRNYLTDVLAQDFGSFVCYKNFYAHKSLVRHTYHIHTGVTKEVSYQREMLFKLLNESVFIAEHASADLLETMVSTIAEL